MALFYGKNNWVDGLSQGGVKKPNLFRRQSSALPDDVDPAIEPSQLPQVQPTGVPNFRKRIMEDSHLAGGLFENPVDPTPMSQNDADKPVPDISGGGEKPKLFAKRNEAAPLDEFGVEIPQKNKTGLFKNLGLSLVDKIFPGFADRATGDTKGYDNNVDNYLKMLSIRATQGNNAETQARESARDAETARSHIANEGIAGKKINAVLGEDPEGERSFSGLNASERKALVDSSPDQLLQLQGHPDKDLATAAKYLYNKKNKTKQLTNPNLLDPGYEP